MRPSLRAAPGLRIAFYQSLGERLGLLKSDVRRQRRHLRIGLELDDNRAISGERLLPGRTDPIGIVNKDALNPNQLGKFVVGHVGNSL